MNKVILMGRLTRDPEVRYTQTNNTLVASFSLAVNRRFARQGEERQAELQKKLILQIVKEMEKHHQILKIHLEILYQNHQNFQYHQMMNYHSRIKS